MTTIKLRRGTLFDWNSENPVLASGEIGIEVDTGKFKIGNDVDYWSVLDYAGGAAVLPDGILFAGDDVTLLAGTDNLVHTGDAVTLLAGTSDLVHEGDDISVLTGTVDLIHIGDDVSLQSSGDVLFHVTTTDDGTPSAGWPNRFEFKWKPNPDTTVGEHLTAWFNEYGEFRVTPAKGNTVPFRAFTKELDSDAEHDSATPVMEMVWSRTIRTPIWGVMADGTMYTSGPIQRRVPSGPTLQSGYLVLHVSESIPAGTPAGTLIVRIPD